MKTRNRTLRFTLRGLMIAVGLLAIALGSVRYFVFPPPLMIQIEPSAAYSVPTNGGFSINGEPIATSTLSGRISNYATSTLGKVRRGRVIAVLPPNCESGTCAEAMDVLGDATFAAGFGDMQVVRSHFDD